MLKLNNLSVLAYANNFTLWHYKSTDKLTTMMEGNYFGNGADMMKQGDMIITSADTDGVPVTAILVVADINGGTVKVTQFA